MNYKNKTKFGTKAQITLTLNYITYNRVVNLKFLKIFGLKLQKFQNFFEKT